MDPETIGLILALIVPVASAISAAVPDSKLGVIAKIVNAAALNFKNAKNDPTQAKLP